jgi:hypothetical protein
MADTFGMSEGLVQRAIANLKKRRQNLLDGKINSIPSPFKRFSNDFIGLEQGMSMGITSFSKSGKTQVTLYLLFEAFLYACEHPSQVKLKVFYYPLEETDERIFNRFQSWLLFKLDKIRISPSNLRSTRNKEPLPEYVHRQRAEVRHRHILYGRGPEPLQHPVHAGVCHQPVRPVRPAAAADRNGKAVDRRGRSWFHACRWLSRPS